MRIHLIFQNKTNLRRTLILIFVLTMSLMVTAQSGFATNSANKKAQGSTDFKTLVVSVPRTTWELLDKTDTPEIDKLVSRGAVAGLSVRTRSTITSAPEAYASLSSGNRAEAPDADVSTYFGPQEMWEGSNAGSLFRRQRGEIANKHVAGLSLGFETVVRSNEKSFYQAKVGTLQEVLARNGRSISVIGNADYCSNDEAGCFDRSAAYFGSDTNGVLADGDISRNLLKFSDSDTTKITLNSELVAQKTKESMKNNSVTLVECSDLQRLEEFKKTSKSDVYEENFLEALTRCDKLVGKIMKDFSFEEDRVIVLSPTSPSGLTQTTLFVAAGKGIPRGFASSASTRHIGSVTLVDLAPSILDSYAISIPKEMGETLFDWQASSKSDELRKDKLVKMNQGALAREDAIGPITTVLVLLAVLGILLSMIALSKGGKWEPLAKFAVFLTAFYPTATYLLKPFYLSLQIPFGLISAVLAISAVGAGLSMLILKKFGIIYAVLAVAIYNLSVHVTDILFGGNLQFNSAFGHSPIIAGRFSGFSNQAFAILSISMVLIVAMVYELCKTKPKKTRNQINFALLAFTVLILVIDGAPFFGSDVGGVLALVPTIFVIAMLIFEKRIGIKTIILSGLATVATLTGFALLDLARPVSKRTHLGRFAESVKNGDAGVTIERKLAASLRTFHSSSWVFIILAFLAFCIFLYARHRLQFKLTINQYPGFRILVLSGLVIGVLGMALNDSGVSIPSMMIVILMVPFTLFMMTTNDQSKAKQ